MDIFPALMLQCLLPGVLVYSENRILRDGFHGSAQKASSFIVKVQVLVESSGDNGVMSVNQRPIRL